MKRARLFILATCCAAALVAAAQLSPPEPEVEHLRAFARLYGYVRYFHPSDEAADADWERLAVHGARQVLEASGEDDLQRTLLDLFLPIAPTLQLFATGEAPPAPSPLLAPEDVTGLQIVAWQHRGLGTGDPRSIYRSARLGRTKTLSGSAPFGTVVQSVDAGPYQGMEVRLRAAARAEVEGSENRVQFWLRTDRPERRIGFFDNMHDRPITSSEWRVYEIIGVIPEDARAITYGGFLMGEGDAWIDAFELHVREPGNDEWHAVALENPGFEEEAGGAISGWQAGNPGYRFSASNLSAFEGERSLRIEHAPQTETYSGALFEAHPHAGELLQKELGAGITVQLPLALYSKHGRTLGGDDVARARLEQELAKVDLDMLTADDVGLRLANIVIAWNALQHFYPYFDVVDVDWDQVLSESLRSAYRDASTEEFLVTLQKMVAALDDGHGSVFHEIRSRERGLPVELEWIEERAVVVATADSTDFRRGDVVLEVDGRAVNRIVSREEERISGSPHQRRRRAVDRIGRGEAGTAAVVLLRRSGDEVEVVADRDARRPPPEPRPSAIAELEQGVFYVDLSRAGMEAIVGRIDELSAADGVVFDMRGYPKRNHQVLSYLSDSVLRSARWQVPQVIYPDREDLAGYDTTGRWLLTPRSPRFDGEIVFLTDSRAISYAESVMGIVEHYELGEIVGQPTAGTNGNVNLLQLPGGFRITWTGMRVVKHDGSQHHLRGIEPTVPVERTLSAVRAGRDELLERALALIRSRR